MRLTFLVFLGLLATLVYPSDDPCFDQIRPCAQACCPSIGGVWSTEEDDCMVDSNYTDEQLQALMDEHCPECFDGYVECIQNDSGSYTATISSPSLCCAPAFLLGGLAVMFMRK
jgi:hypothetical protein